MKRIRVWVWMCLACSFVLSTRAYPQNTFEDPRGRFALDLPAGWKFTPSKDNPDENVYLFGDLEKSSGQIKIVFSPDARDIGELFSLALKDMKTNWPEAAPEGDLVDLEVGGHPARWRLYRLPVEVEAGGMKVKLMHYGSLGSVVLDEGGLFFFWIFLRERNTKKLQQDFEKVFQSIRMIEGEGRREGGGGKQGSYPLHVS